MRIVFNLAKVNIIPCKCAALSHLYSKYKAIFLSYITVKNIGIAVFAGMAVFACLRRLYIYMPYGFLKLLTK